MRAQVTRHTHETKCPQGGQAQRQHQNVDTVSGNGLFKSLIFGLVVAAVGCIRGMQTRGGAIAVGVSTTRAVVSGIVLIVIADALCGVVFFQLGI